MKIAVPMHEGKFCEHFGGAQAFAFYMVDEDDRNIGDRLLGIPGVASSAGRDGNPGGWNGAASRKYLCSSGCRGSPRRSGRRPGEDSPQLP